MTKAKEDNNWLTANIVKYPQGHRLRVESKEITGSTLRNYISLSSYFANKWTLKYLGKSLSGGYQGEGGTQMTDGPMVIYINFKVITERYDQ